MILGICSSFILIFFPYLQKYHSECGNVVVAWKSSLVREWAMCSERDILIHFREAVAMFSLITLDEQLKYGWIGISDTITMPCHYLESFHLESMLFAIIIMCSRKKKKAMTILMCIVVDISA